MFVSVRALLSLVEHVVWFALGTWCSIEARGHSKDCTLLAAIVGAVTHAHAHAVSTFALVLLAHADASKDEDEDELGAPDPGHGNVIVGHHPFSCRSRASDFDGRRHAHHCIVGVKEDTANDHDDELHAAADVGAVGREHSCSPPPCADERAEHVEGEEAKGDLVDRGDNAKTRAELLAIQVAVLHDSDVGLHSIQVTVLIENNGGFRCAVRLKAETPVDFVIIERVFDNSLGNFILLGLSWHAKRQAL